MSSVATILSWDPDTYSNRLDRDGAVLVDVPVFEGMEARTFRPGDRLQLIQLGDGTVAIAGRLVTAGGAG